MPKLETRIARIVIEEAQKCGGSFSGPLARSTSLADTGLDSLGFAALMVALEKEIGHDPFSNEDEIQYPETFGELVDLYENAR